MSNRFSRFGLVLLLGWLTLLVFWMVRPTLALPYYSDDFDHGQLIAQIRAGLRPARDLIILPFHGQTLVLLRLLFWFGTLAGGMDLTWVRVGVSAVHIAAAAGCAILCARWTGSKLAGFLAGSLYAGALGFINEQIWWPSSAIFCLGAAFFILAMVAIEYDSIGWAVLMLVIASLGLNGVLIPGLVLPVYCWLSGRRRAAGVLLCVILALLALAFWQQRIHHDQEQISLSLRGFGLGAWLILTAPLRFFSGFTTFAVPGFQTIFKLSPLAWLPLLASVWFMQAHHRRVLLTVWTPAILLAFLVGFARANFYPDRYGPGVLYIGDRYYYFFLLPLVTHCVLLASTFKMRRFAPLALLVILTAAGLIASRARYLANVPRNNFEAAARALTEGRLLAQTIRSYAAAQPLTLTDAPIPIDGSHLNSLTLAFLVYSEYPHGIPGVSFVRGPLDSQQTAIENSLLKPWARAASSGISFKDGSYQEDLTSGFSWWEPPFRWIGGHASLHLISAPGDLVISAYAPVVLLHRAIHVTVMVNDHPAGGFTISDSGVHDYHLRPPALAPGTQDNITLTSDVVWHARDIFPQSLDERDLSIALSSIGFAPPVASP